LGTGQKETWKKPGDRLYVPRVMADMMVAATTNSTSVHFGFGHMYRAHNTLFTMEHVEQCSEIVGCKNIRTYAHKLKEEHILRWDPEERHAAILEFALLTIQMKNLESTSQAPLVQTHRPGQYIKTGGRRGRPRKQDQVARTCAKVT
jgi:hypothetical protein